MKRILIVLFLLVPCLCFGAEYTYYFSNAGDDGNTCLNNTDDVCATIAKADAMVNALAATDVVYLKFNRGDEWVLDSDAESTDVTYGLSISTTNPVTHIDAYGTGDKPSFNGTVDLLTNGFADAPIHAYPGTGPFIWNRYVNIEQDGCSITDIDFNWLYGHAVYTKGADNLTVTNCMFRNLGKDAIAANSTSDFLDYEISYNTIKTIEQLFLNDRDGGAQWAGAITLKTGVGNVSSGHHIHHNLIYDISGEGVIAHSEYGYNDTIIEYNIVGDTCSTGLMVDSHGNNPGVAIVRYNLLTFSDYSTSDYSTCYLATGSGSPVALRVYDDHTGGSNANADYQIYGNVTINRDIGFRFFSPEDPDDTFGSLKLYNNTFIDSVDTSIHLYHPERITTAEIYNNVSVFYDRVEGVNAGESRHAVTGDGTWPAANWTLDNNAFYSTTGDLSTVSSSFLNNVTGDPKLSGGDTVNWISQTSATYYSDIKFTDIEPTTGSSLFNSAAVLGAGFDDDLLSGDTDFTGTELGTATFTLATQDSTPDIGAAIASNKYYFSNTGTATTGCTEADPCSTLAHANAILDGLASTDTAYLYFNRGDTWTWDSANAGLSLYAFRVDDTNPITHISAYGTGADPVFDGLVTDFSTVGVHDPNYNACNASGTPVCCDNCNGPIKWSAFFIIRREGSSISNVEIKNVYGHAVFLDDNSGSTDGFILENSSVSNFGSSAISTDGSYGTTNCEVANNTIHTGQQLAKNLKILKDIDVPTYGGWSGAVVFAAKSRGTDSRCADNHIHHNLIYDIYGEGIISANSIVEYNLVGDTASYGISSDVRDWDLETGIIRYNMVTFSDYSTSEYTQIPPTAEGGATPDGIRTYDDNIGGDNTSGTVSIYGNIVINRDTGIQFFSPEDPSPYGTLEIYNNTVIDSNDYNYSFKTVSMANSAYIYNNTSVYYNNVGDSSGSKIHVGNSDSTFPDAGWIFSNNSYWPVDAYNTVISDAAVNYVTGDPKLSGAGTVNWTSQTGATYYFNIKLADTTPTTGSSLIGAGSSTYLPTLYVYPADLTGMPDGGNFTTSSQTAPGIIGAMLHEASTGGKYRFNPMFFLF